VIISLKFLNRSLTGAGFSWMQVGLSDLMQHVVARPSAGPAAGGVAAQYPEGFFSDEGASAKSSAEYVAQAGTDADNAMSRSKTTPLEGGTKPLAAKISMTRFEPIDITPAKLIDTDRNGVRDSLSLQRTKSALT